MTRYVIYDDHWRSIPIHLSQVIHTLDAYCDECCRDGFRPYLGLVSPRTIEAARELVEHVNCELDLGAGGLVIKPEEE
jgi:hypothetical protein